MDPRWSSGASTLGPTAFVGLDEPEEVPPSLLDPVERGRELLVCNRGDSPVPKVSEIRGRRTIGRGFDERTAKRVEVVLGSRRDRILFNAPPSDVETWNGGEIDEFPALGFSQPVRGAVGRTRPGPLLHRPSIQPSVRLPFVSLPPPVTFPPFVSPTGATSRTSLRSSSSTRSSSAVTRSPSGGVTSNSSRRT